MFIYKNKLYLIFFTLSISIGITLMPSLFAAEKSQSNAIASQVLPQKLLEEYKKAINRYEQIFDLLYKKTGVDLIYPFFKVLEAQEEEFTPIELANFLEKCHFEKLSDDEWQTLRENFKKLTEKGRLNGIQKLFFEDEKYTAHDFLNELPAFLRKQKQEAKVETLQKEACQALQDEYDATKQNSSLDNLLLVVLGIFKGSFNQDISMGKAKLVNEIVPVIPLLTYRKPLAYFGKKIPEAISYLRQNKNYSKIELAVNKAKEDYIAEHLSNDFINDLSIIASQTGTIRRIDPSYDSRSQDELGMIPYKNAAGELIKKHCDFLPEYLFYPAQLIMTSALYNVGPAFINLLMQESLKADSITKMTTEEKLEWEHLRKDYNFANSLSSFISNFCAAGILFPLNETLGKAIKQVTKDFTPLRVLLDKNLSYQSMRSWGKIAGNGISTSLHLYDAHPTLKQRFLKKYKTGAEKADFYLANDFNEYARFKGPETLARNTLHGVLAHGLQGNEKTIVEGIDSIGEGLAKGTKMILPDAVADPLVDGVRKAKSLGEMGTKALGYLYYMFKLKKNQEGQEGLKTVIDDARNPFAQKYFFNDLITRRFSKFICHTIYNKALNDTGAPEISTASIAQLTTWSVLWYLFNSGQPIDAAKEIMSQLE